MTCKFQVSPSDGAILGGLESLTGKTKRGLKRDGQPNFQFL